MVDAEVRVDMSFVGLEGMSGHGADERGEGQGPRSGFRPRAGSGSALELRDLDEGERHEVAGPEVVLVHRQQAQVADLRPESEICPGLLSLLGRMQRRTACV